jgi:hypothetical protein
MRLAPGPRLGGYLLRGYGRYCNHRGGVVNMQSPVEQEYKSGGGGGQCTIVGRHGLGMEKGNGGRWKACECDDMCQSRGQSVPHTTLPGGGWQCTRPPKRKNTPPPIESREMCERAVEMPVPCWRDPRFCTHNASVLFPLLPSFRALFRAFRRPKQKVQLRIFLWYAYLVWSRDLGYRART